MSTSVGAVAAASAIRQVRTRIRLSRKGCANRPFYHIVIMQKGSVKGDPMEQIGTFDPLVNKHNEKLVAINVDRLKYWLAQGAIPSDSAGQILGLSGFLPIHPRTYLDSRRRQAAEIVKAAEAAESAKAAEEAAKAAEKSSSSESKGSSVDSTTKSETDDVKDSKDKSEPTS